MHPHLENQELYTEGRKAPNAESAKYRDLNSPNTHFVFQAPGIEKPVYRAVTTDIRD